jgi:cytochrome P450
MCFWELAKNNMIQTELIAEVDAVAKTMNSKSLSYNQLLSMKYLEMFIYETLRKHPPLFYGMRVCNKDCSIKTHDGELFKFLRGDLIQIPYKLLQNGAKYFPNPENFNPLRFSDPLNCKSFLAFGLGPRKCPKVSSEVAMFQVKTFIFFVLKKYTIEMSKKTVALNSNEDKLYLTLMARAEN